MIRQLNQWWDGLPEPRRTLYFFGSAILIFTLSVFEPTKPIAGVLFVVATLWGLTRF